MQKHSVQENDIDWIEYWNVIWRWKKMIIILALVATLFTAIISLFMKNIYKANTVLTAVSTNGQGGMLSSLAQQFGGIAALAGLSIGSSSGEIESYLNSNRFREELIDKYNLLPVIFSDSWDKEGGKWKKPGIVSRYLLQIKSVISPQQKKKKGDSFAPSVWDGMRALEKNIINVTTDKKSDSVTISVNMDDPDVAAEVASDAINTLRALMSADAQDVADVNRKKLEDLLKHTSDPTIRQNIFALLNQQIQNSLMSEVNQNFAFKIIDPPMAPDQKAKPKRTLMVVLSFVISLCLGVFVALFRENLARRIEFQKEISADNNPETKPTL